MFWFWFEDRGGNFLHSLVLCPYPPYSRWGRNITWGLVRSFFLLSFDKLIISCLWLTLFLCVWRSLKQRPTRSRLMHLRIRALELHRPPPHTSTPADVCFPTASPEHFHVNRHVPLAPSFRERLRLRPKDVWSLSLQCKLVGKAQEVCASLSNDQSRNDEIVKATVLRN